jgi:hypothetical protein
MRTIIFISPLNIAGVELKIGKSTFLLSTYNTLYLKVNNQFIKASKQLVDQIKTDLSEKYSDLKFIDPLSWHLFLHFCAFDHE